ncbi:MAG: DM13 domain-containing protein [Acidimicrobiia bacterium]|nr:DM13 domain-containing protein [Acidimicrobiia bacterium]
MTPDPEPVDPGPEPDEPVESEPDVSEPDEPVESEADVSEPDEPVESEADAGGPGEVVRLVEGSFVDRSHPTEGVAVVLNDGTQQRFLRFEDFATDNGPDLNVYLSSAPADASAGAFDDDFVDLGDLKGNIGAQNYEIPTDVDLDRHSTVVIWCVRFGVVFGAAELN